MSRAISRRFSCPVTACSAPRFVTAAWSCCGGWTISVHAAAKGSTAGIPLLYPWANRLAAPRYRAAGREVDLDPSSPLLHLDNHGLPMHGVPWALLAWDLTEARQDFIAARLEWSRQRPARSFSIPSPARTGGDVGSRRPHNRDDFGRRPRRSRAGKLRLSSVLWAARASTSAVAIETTGDAEANLDGRGIPTGKEEPFRDSTRSSAQSTSTMGLRCWKSSARFFITGAGRRISVELLAGYRYAQVFAPKDQSYIALEPMTAPANALISGQRPAGCGTGRTVPGGVPNFYRRILRQVSDCRSARFIVRGLLRSHGEPEPVSATVT